jgi:uncharacterized protein YkwD
MLAMAACGDPNSMRTKRFLTVALGTIILTLTAASPTLASGHSRLPAQAAASSCAGASSATQDISHLMKTVLCLHNRERHQHGLRTLRWNNDLSRAASGHARDMVRRHYFDHRSPSGADHMDRIAAVHYGASSRTWSAGENLLSSAVHPTPQQLFRAWMGSAKHRRNILRSRWHEFGLGVVATSPSGQRGGLTIVALFGVRH